MTDPNAETHASADERLAPNWEGAVIGRYRIGPRLGAGGMGQVHLATMTGAAGFSRVVAMKRLHSEYSHDPRMRARFEREIRLSARIVHPNVVQVLDVIQSGDDLMFVMEYVAGDTLRALRAAVGAGEHIPLGVVTGIIVPALHGLHAAHETRDADGKRLLLVHRDFSPDNVMIGPDGEVKVLDFGIAKAAQEAQTTKPGSIAGKLSYMSPEQALGLELDARSDVFAAGTVLWEMLVGQRLFRSHEVTPVAILHQVLNAEIPPPSQHRRDVPAALDHVVMRALQRDVAARFSSAREFALALEAAVAPASAFSVGQSLQRFCGDLLRERAASLARFRAKGSDQPALELTDVLALGGDFADASFSSSHTFASLEDSRRTAPRRPAAKVGKVLGALALLSGVAASAWWLWPREEETSRRPGPSPREISVAAPGAETEPQRAETEPQRAETEPQRAETEPQRAETEPQRAETEPRDTLTSPVREDIASARVEPVATASPSSSAQRAPVPRPAQRVKARQPSSAASNCTPPTYVDAEGIRHFKPHCL